jgi:hypothetical protein
VGRPAVQSSPYSLIRIVRAASRLKVFDYNRPQGQEIKMSGINGDKARFNRRRRQKISRRLSNQKMLKALEDKHLTPPAAQASPKEKVA